jgi:hypothetical protein
MVKSEVLFVRSASAFAASFLYLLMGMVRMYPGSIKALLEETRQAISIGQGAD